MSLTIKTNMPSIRTQSALASSTDKLNQTIERINFASPDLGEAAVVGFVRNLTNAGEVLVNIFRNITLGGAV